MSLLERFKSCPIAFGGASISGEGGGYGFGDIAEADAIFLLRYAFDLGVRIFDTAPIYGFGLSEKRMGMAFKNLREKVFLVSKSGVTWHSSKRVDMTNDPKVTQKMLEQSLKDLDTDYVDLYMIHWPDQRVDIRRPMEVLARARLQGKIRHIGLCNTNKQEILLAKEVDKVEVVQNELSFLARESLSLLPFLQEGQISFMSWGTLAKGLLTGRVNEKRKFDPSDCRSWAPWWKKSHPEKKYEKMKELSAWLQTKGHTGLELALSYNLHQKGVDVLLCGMKTLSQAEEIIKAIKNPVKKEILDEASRLCGYSDL